MPGRLGDDAKLSGLWTIASAWARRVSGDVSECPDAELPEVAYLNLGKTAVRAEAKTSMLAELQSSEDFSQVIKASIS